MRQRFFCANVITGSGVVHYLLCFVYFMGPCFHFCSMLMMVVFKNKIKKWMGTHTYHNENSVRISMNILENNYKVFFVFFKTDLEQKRMLFLSLAVSSSDRISDHLPEDPCDSALKLKFQHPHLCCETRYVLLFLFSSMMGIKFNWNWEKHPSYWNQFQELNI